MVHLVTSGIGAVPTTGHRAKTILKQPCVEVTLHKVWLATGIVLSTLLACMYLDVLAYNSTSIQTR